MVAMTAKKDRICPNCRKGGLKPLLGEWVCHECEFHSKTGKKRKGSFR